MENASHHITNKSNNSVAFNIDFTVKEEDGSKKIGRPPAKFSEYKKTRTSLEEIERKQQQASERRKEQETARLARVRERQEECQRLNARVSRLLGAEAKRQGLPGTEALPPMSRQEAGRSLQEVARSMGRITGNIAQLE